VRIQLGREAERACQLGGARVREHGAVGERDRRRRLVLRLTCTVRDPEAGQGGAQLVGPGGAEVGHHGRARGPFALQPLRLLQELRDRAVEDLVARTSGPEDVEVDPAPGHAPQHELRGRSVGPAEPRDQQAAAGGGEAPADTGEQGGAVLARREHDGHVLAVGVRLLERLGQLRGRAAADAVVSLVAARQLAHDPAALGRIVVCDHEQGAGGG
jgi:hypothetical protein